MKRYFTEGQTLRFSENAQCFTINEIIGTGSSCVVYRATASDGTEHLLKEYNPKFLDLARDPDGNLFVRSEEDRAAFAEGLRCFNRGFQRQTQIRSFTDLRNVTSNTQGYYLANGTAYIDMTLFSGTTLNQCRFASIHDMARCFRAITRVISNYHDKGFLHLDLKPENIFVLPETPEMVMLFDFDSVTQKNDVRIGGALSYTKSWAAPEQLIPGKASKICEETDLYAIGEMLFWFLFGRHSAPEERRSFSELRMDGASEWTHGLERSAVSLLREILKHTVSNTIANRYPSADTLWLQLNELCRATDPDRPQLTNSLPSAQPFFIGRNEELQEIKDLLQQGGSLFVCGVGGIGKTELVKQYVLQNRDRYRHIQYAICQADLMQTITDDRMVPIRNFISQPDETNAAYYDRKMRKLGELMTADDLLVLDNLDSLEDAQLSEVLALPCTVLATTRRNAGEYGFQEVRLDVFRSEEDVRRLFLKYYTKPLTPEQAATVDAIIGRMESHTMAVELLAKQMMRGRIDPAEMLARLERGGLDETGREVVLSAKDSKPSRASAYEHIRMMFDLSGLDAQSLTVLENLALIPKTGVDASRFVQWCGLDGYDTINDLVLSGWIREDAQTDHISLHPLIAELAIEHMGGKSDDCAAMLRSITDYLQSDAFDTVDADERADLICIVSGIASVLLREKIFDAATADYLDASAVACKGFGNRESAGAWLQTALRIRTETDGMQSKKTADTLQHLAVFQQENGRLDEAQDLYIQALQIRKDLFGENHKETADSYEVLGNLYVAKGEFNEAEHLLQLSLDIRLQCDPKPEEGIARSYMSFACYNNAKGFLDIAVQNEQIVLNSRLCLYGKKHSLTAEAYSDLGVYYAEQGQLDIAEQHYLCALEIYEDLYADTHKDTAIVCNNLCNLLQKYERVEDARQYGERAKTIMEKVYGKEHIALLEIDGNLGGVYQSLGQYELSEQHYQHALNVCADTYGYDDVRTACALMDLGNLYLEMCKLNLAETHYLQAHEILQKQTDRSRDLARSYNRLGHLYYQKRQYGLAEANCRKGLEIREALCQGNHDRDLAASYHNMAMICWDMGDIEKAKRYLLKAYTVFSKLTPSFNQDRATVLLHLGECYFESWDLKKADACLQKVYGFYENCHREGSAEMAFSCTSLGKLALTQADYTSAERFIRQSLEIRRKLYGEDHVGIAANLYTLGNIYSKTGRYEQAILDLEQAYALFSRLCGETNKDTQDAKELLQQVRREMNP